MQTHSTQSGIIEQDQCESQIGPWRRSDATPVWPPVKPTEGNQPVTTPTRPVTGSAGKWRRTMPVRSSAQRKIKNPHLTIGVWTQMATPIRHVGKNLKTLRAVATLRHQRGYSGANYDTSPDKSPKPLRRHFGEKYHQKEVRNKNWEQGRREPT